MEKSFIKNNKGDIMSKKIFKKFLIKRVEKIKKAKINKGIKHRKIAPGRPNQGRR